MEWKPASTVPRNAFVLAYGCGELCGWINGIMIGIAKYDGHFWWNNEAERISPPTYWMPLPSPPKTDH